MSDPVYGALLAALHERLKIQPARDSSSGTQIRLVVRVPPNVNRAWIKLAFAMLRTAEGKPWTLDISKMLVVTPEERFGWRIIIQGPDLPTACRALVETTRVAPITSTVVSSEQEVQLVGSPNRSKTAGLYGHVAVGGAVRS